MAKNVGITMPHEFSSLLYNFVPSDFCTCVFNGRTIDFVYWATFSAPNCNVFVEDIFFSHFNKVNILGRFMKNEVNCGVGPKK